MEFVRLAADFMLHATKFAKTLISNSSFYTRIAVYFTGNPLQRNKIFVYTGIYGIVRIQSVLYVKLNIRVPKLKKNKISCDPRHIFHSSAAYVFHGQPLR